MQREQRRFLYNPTEATRDSSTTLGHKKHLRLGRHPRLHFSASRSSSRPVTEQKLSELTSVLAAWQAPGPIRIHRLATPEGRARVGKSCDTFPNNGHRADMSEARGNEKMDVVIFAALPFVTDKDLRAPIGCAAIKTLCESRRRKASLRTSLFQCFHTPGGTGAVAHPHQTKSHLPTQATARDFGTNVQVRSYLEGSPKCGCTLASDTGSATLREPSA